MRTTGYVAGIDGVLADVTLKSAGETQVRVDIRMGASSPPQVGQTWLLDKTYGFWVFVLLLGADVPSWQVPALRAPWTASNTGAWAAGSSIEPPVGYFRSMDGWVRLRGSVASGVPSTADTAGPIAADLFQLPVGYRPSPDGLLRFAALSTTSTSALGEVKVYPDGWVRVSQSANTRTSLANVAFQAGG